jgi:hypothetical protein
LRDGGSRFFGCFFLLRGGGFFCLLFLFDFKLVLFPFPLGGLLLCRLVGKDLFGCRAGLRLAQCLQGLLLVIAPAWGGLRGYESRPAHADTTG